MKNVVDIKWETHYSRKMKSDYESFKERLVECGSHLMRGKYWQQRFFNDCGKEFVMTQLVIRQLIRQGHESWFDDMSTIIKKMCEVARSKRIFYPWHLRDDILGMMYYYCNSRDVGSSRHDSDLMFTVMDEREGTTWIRTVVKTGTIDENYHETMPRIIMYFTQIKE